MGIAPRIRVWEPVFHRSGSISVSVKGVNDRTTHRGVFSESVCMVG